MVRNYLKDLLVSLLCHIQKWIFSYEMPVGTVVGVTRFQLAANREVKVHQEVTVVNIKLKISMSQNN